MCQQIKILAIKKELKFQFSHAKIIFSIAERFGKQLVSKFAKANSSHKWLSAHLGGTKFPKLESAVKHSKEVLTVKLVLRKQNAEKNPTNKGSTAVLRKQNSDGIHFRRGKKGVSRHLCRWNSLFILLSARSSLE